jgi:hypothetical protein
MIDMDFYVFIHLSTLTLAVLGGVVLGFFLGLRLS